MKQFVVRLDNEKHRKLKMYAAAKQTTMQALIVESIAKLLSQPVNP